MRHHARLVAPALALVAALQLAGCGEGPCPSNANCAAPDTLHPADATADTAPQPDAPAEAPSDAGAEAGEDAAPADAPTDAPPPADAGCDNDGDGFTAVVCGGDDCDDNDPEIHPGASERCNGYDDDCDGLGDGYDYDALDAYCAGLLNPSNGTANKAPKCVVPGMEPAGYLSVPAASCEWESWMVYECGYEYGGQTYRWDCMGPRPGPQ